jgi:hypothetical protein
MANLSRLRIDLAGKPRKLANTIGRKRSTATFRTQKQANEQSDDSDCEPKID